MESGMSLTELLQFIVWPYMVAFVLLSSLVKKAFGDLLQRVTKFEWKPVYTVMAIAFIIAIPYAIVLKINWIPMLITYTIGTSFHELIWSYVEKGVKRLFGA